MKPMFVYVLEWRHYEESQVLGVFFSQDGALKHLEEINEREYTIDNFKFDEYTNSWSEIGYTSHVISMHKVRP